MSNVGNFLHDHQPERDRRSLINNMGSAVIGEVTKQVEVPEIDKDLKATYVDRPEGSLLCGCGDERGCTHASAESIMDEYELRADGPILRLYGGAVGLSRSVLVALEAQSLIHGSDALARFRPEDFIEFTYDAYKRAIAKTGVTFALHSASANEQNKRTLNLDSHTSIGCAYAANIGKVSALAAHDKDVLAQAVAEGRSIFGKDFDEEIFGIIPTANERFGAVVLGEPDYSVERHNFQTIGAPVMLLDGDHLHANETQVVENFTVHELSDPNLAAEINRRHYVQDMTQVAEVILKSYPEMKLDARTLLMAMHLDVVATRAALTGGKPSDLKLERYGDASQAIEYLNSIALL